MKKKSILIIDDDVDICTLLERYFKRKGFEVKVAFSGAKGINIVREGGVNLVLSDFRLPDKEGYDVIREVKKFDASIPVIVITGYSDVNQAVKAIQLGAYEYVTKPIYPEEILALVKKAIEKSEQKQTASELEELPPQSSIDKDNPFEAYLVPRSNYSHQLQEQIALVSPTNMTVIIIGETGTGKEVVARMIHKSSKRRNRNFVPVDCGSLTQELAASELFGHVKGSFTGATSDKKGSFELANNGTLFLDEIGNLSYENQVKLLRVLQERKIRRVGSEKEIPVNVRIIVATNEDLRKAIAKNKFRQDIYYRVNEFKINLKPLRETPHELEEFVHFFVERANQRLGKSITKIEKKVWDKFNSYPWPGNIRELKNTIHRSILVAGEEVLKLEDLPEEIINEEAHLQNNLDDWSVLPSSFSSMRLKDVTEWAESKAIKKAIEKANNNKSKAAKILGIDRKTLYNKMEAYGLQ